MSDKACRKRELALQMYMAQESKRVAWVTAPTKPIQEWDCLAHIPRVTPTSAEVRCCFGKGAHGLLGLLGTFCSDGVYPRHQALPSGVERFHFSTKDGLSIWAWTTARQPTQAQLWRLLLHDIVLDAEYVVFLDPDAPLRSLSSDGVVSLLDERVDYVGQPAWHEYRACDLDRVKACASYMGVPFARRDGRQGVEFMPRASSPCVPSPSVRQTSHRPVASRPGMSFWAKPHISSAGRGRLINRACR